jgi:predicted DNA-binding transcriptional regulator AlpA
MRPEISKSWTRINPRIIRHRDAPRYCGIDRTRFDTEVRPYLTVVPFGARSIGFDRLEIDEWIEEYISVRGRPGRNMKGVQQCEPEQKGSASKEKSGSSTSSTVAVVSSSASVRSRKKKQRLNCEDVKTQSMPKSRFDVAVNACGQMVRGST